MRVKKKEATERLGLETDTISSFDKLHGGMLATIEHSQSILIANFVIQLENQM